MKLLFTKESEAMLSDSSAPEGRRTKSRVTGAGRQTAGPPGAAAGGHTGLGQDSARRENLPPKVQGCGRAPDVYAGREDTGPALEEPRAQRGTLRGTPGVRGASLSACIHGGDPFPRGGDSPSGHTRSPVSKEVPPNSQFSS